MSHQLSGIITSFKTQDEHPNIILVGNYRFIPVSDDHSFGKGQKVLAPYDSFRVKTRKLIRELSFSGPCAYIETLFFVEGIQLTEVWNQGKKVEGPLISFHHYNPERLKQLKEKYALWKQVDEAINSALRMIGIFRHEGKDEFETARLNEYRSNGEVKKDIIFGKRK